VLRRVSYVFSAIVLVIVIAVSVADREADKSRAVAPPLTTPTGPPPPTVTGTLPADRIVEARVGDAVTITVTSPEPDEAVINALGLQTETDPEQPGLLEFVAEDPGRYPVALLDTGKVVGTVVVEPGR
jgi:hypothetical protein